jgi:hypothetical protein
MRPEGTASGVEKSLASVQALTSRTWRGGGAQRFRPQRTRRVAAAKKGGSRGAFPVRSPAWTINCQRAWGRGAALRGRRASFPRSSPIRRGLCGARRALRAAFPASRSLPRGLRASFPAFRVPFPPLKRRDASIGPRSPLLASREGRGTGHSPFSESSAEEGMELEDLSGSCTSQGMRPDSWGMSRSPLFGSRSLRGTPPDLQGMRHEKRFRYLKVPSKQPGTARHPATEELDSSFSGD